MTSTDAAAADGSELNDAQPRAGWRELVATALIVLIVGSALTYLVIGTFHAPKPHKLPIAVNAPAATLKLIQSASEARYGDIFDLQAVPDQKTGVQKVQNREAYGFLFVTPKGKSQFWLFEYAGANGPQVNDLIAGAFRPSDQTVQFGTANIVPSAKGDQSGMSVFFTVLCLTLAGLLLGALFVRHARVRFVDALLALLVSSALIGVAAMLLVAVVFDSLPSGVMAAILFGLLVFVTATLTYAAGRRSALKGIGVAAFVLGAFGVVTSATLWPQPYLPGVVRFLTDVLPAGLAGQATVGNAYFNNESLGLGLIGLIVWVLVAVAFLFFVERPRLGRATSAESDGSLAEDVEDTPSTK